MRQLRVLLFGRNGQLARELIRLKPPFVDLHSLDRAGCDFSDPRAGFRAIMAAEAPDLIVNAVGYTAVEKAETEREVAFRINCDTVAELARAAAQRGLPLIHVSTDYVFDGSKRKPYCESDKARPLNCYGESKLAGEQAIRELHGSHVILRTSWVYSVWSRNFLKTMLELGKERDQLQIVNDQIGTPTSATRLAQVIYAIATRLVHQPPRDYLFGTFHYSDEGATTWFQFAQSIFAFAGSWRGVRATLVPITSTEYPGTTKRPMYSVLDCNKIRNSYDISQEPWEKGVERVIEQLQKLQNGG